MAISAVVITIGFYGLYLFQLQQQQIEKNESIWAAERRLFGLISHDTRTKDYVFWDGRQLYFFDVVNDTVIYQIEEGHVIRTYGPMQSFRDSFTIKVASFDCQLDGKATRTYSFCNEVVLEIRRGDQNLKWRSTKIYDVSNWQYIEEQEDEF